jgi:hypothetical protein
MVRRIKQELDDVHTLRQELEEDRGAIHDGPPDRDEDEDEDEDEEGDEE